MGTGPATRPRASATASRAGARPPTSRPTRRPTAPCVRARLRPAHARLRGPRSQRPSSSSSSSFVARATRPGPIASPRGLVPRLASRAQECVRQTGRGWTFRARRTRPTRRRSARIWASATAPRAAAAASRASRATPASDVRDAPPRTPRREQVWVGPAPLLNSSVVVVVVRLPSASCPNGCSGHGKCVSLAQMASEPNAMPVRRALTYGGLESTTTWDENKIFGCVCDSAWAVGLKSGEVQEPSWFGPDCSLRTFHRERSWVVVALEESFGSQHWTRAMETQRYSTIAWDSVLRRSLPERRRPGHLRDGCRLRRNQLPVLP